MLETKQEREHFLKEFNISDERFRESQFTWESLIKIADDFEAKRSEHQNTVKKYAEVIQQCSYVHSLSYRVKDTTHLLEKIIRKNVEYLIKGDSLSESNYERNITDLMGIRVLLLFKEDWIPVHEHIMGIYGDKLIESPFAYIRSGDDKRLYEKKVEIRDTKPYRSVHYVIGAENGLGVEIQVRTLYEEAWSEIDHKLRYPYNLSNEMINAYINIMNRVTGLGDEMGSFVNSYIRNFQEGLLKGVVDDNEVYHFILEKIETCEDEKTKQAIIDKIRQAEKYQERKKTADLLKMIL